MGTAALRPYRLDVHLPVSGLLGDLADDVRRGLTARPKWLLPKYLYDERGCALFEEITRLPEYYQTRTELEILRHAAPGIVARIRPTELVELGSGSSRKTEVLLDAMEAAGGLRRYLPFDISPGALLSAAGRLAEAYPGLRVHGVAGDFERHLEGVPARPWGGRRIVAFLGGTIGNLHPEARAPFLRAVARLLGPGDGLVLGTDLAGDPARLEPAYDDAAGVTAAFNLNLLRVLNRELDADFDLAGFAHVAVYRQEPAWIEMRLRARRPQRVRLRAIDLEVSFDEDEEVLTELSCKFTPDAVRAMYAAAELELAEWHTDPGERFAVSVATRA
jgi:L-histidine Nalpha-methyltransferase